MKTTLSASAYTFSPTTGTITLNVPNFAIGNLYAIINTTTGNQVLYAAGAGSTLGYSALSGSTLTLTVSTSGMFATDNLLILYDYRGVQPQATSQSVTVASDQYAGDTTFGPALPVRSPPLEVLLESILIELVVLNQQIVQQSPIRDELDRLRNDAAADLQDNQVAIS